MIDAVRAVARRAVRVLDLGKYFAPYLDIPDRMKDNAAAVVALAIEREPDGSRTDFLCFGNTTQKDLGCIAEIDSLCEFHDLPTPAPDGTYSQLWQYFAVGMAQKGHFYRRVKCNLCCILRWPRQSRKGDRRGLSRTGWGRWSPARNPLPVVLLPTRPASLPAALTQDMFGRRLFHSQGP